MDNVNEQILKHISEYISQINEANEMFNAEYETLQNNSVYRNAVALCILKIGELAGHLTESFRNDTSDKIPWKAVRGLRNIVVHHYGKIDYESLWETITQDIPELEAFCSEKLSK